MTQQEIAQELGLTQQGVDFIEKKALKKCWHRWIKMHGTETFPLTDGEMFDIMLSSLRQRKSKKRKDVSTRSTSLFSRE